MWHPVLPILAVVSADRVAVCLVQPGDGALQMQTIIPASTVTFACWTSGGSHLLMAGISEPIWVQKVECSPHHCQLTAGGPTPVMLGESKELRALLPLPASQHGVGGSAEVHSVFHGLDGVLAVFSPGTARYRASRAGLLDFEALEERLEYHTTALDPSAAAAESVSDTSGITPLLAVANAAHVISETCEFDFLLCRATNH